MNQHHQSLLTSHLSRFRLNVGLRFWKADNFRALFELPALLQEVDAFEALQDIPFRGDRAGSL